MQSGVYCGGRGWPFSGLRPRSLGRRTASAPRSVAAGALADWLSRARLATTPHLHTPSYRPQARGSKRAEADKAWTEARAAAQQKWTEQQSAASTQWAAAQSEAEAKWRKLLEDHEARLADQRAHHDRVYVARLEAIESRARSMEEEQKAAHSKLIEEERSAQRTLREETHASVTAAVETARREVAAERKAQTDGLATLVADQVAHGERVRSELTAAVTEAIAATQAGRNEVTALVEEVRESTGVAAATAQSGHHRRQSEEDASSAAMWRIATLALIFLAVAAASGVLVLLTMDNKTPTWEDLALRFGVLAAIYVGFGYAARVAGDFQRSARLNRQLSIELATLNSFLANLPKEHQDEVKRSLVDRYFSAGKSSDATSIGPRAASDIGDKTLAAASSVADVIAKVKGKEGP